MPLTDTAIRNAKKKPKQYKVYDEYPLLFDLMTGER